MAGLVNLDDFVITFLDRFFSCELMESKVHKLINMKQGKIFVEEYSLNLT